MSLNQLNFYRVMRMHCADYVAHTGILLKWINISSNFFSPQGCHTILVFHTKRIHNIPTGTPITRRRMQWGMKTNRNFQPISRFISEMIQHRTLVIMVGKYKTVLSFGMVPFSMTFSDP